MQLAKGKPANYHCPGLNEEKCKALGFDSPHLSQDESAERLVCVMSSMNHSKSIL